MNQTQWSMILWNDAQTALTSVLEAQGLDVASLPSGKQDAVKAYSEALSQVAVSDIQTVSDVTHVLGDSFDFLFTEDFRSLDGQKLNGVATEDGQIVLDDALEGQELKSVLIEELAEAAYFELFGTASIGDFGAEVAYVAAGGEDMAVISSLRTENDSVQTAYGKAEASQWAFKNQFTEELKHYTNGNAYNFYISSVYKEGAAYVENSGSTAFVSNFAANNLSKLDGKYDLNNDGLLDTYSIRSGYGLQLDSFGVHNARYVPLNGHSTKAIVDNGYSGANGSWTTSKGESFTFGGEVNWSTTVGASVGTEVGFLGSKFNVEVNVSNTFGGSLSASKNYTSTKSSTLTYDNDDFYNKYKDDGVIRVSMGLHAVVADVQAAEDTVWLVDIDNAKHGYANTINLRGKVWEDVDSHLVDIVLADYDLNNPPELDHLYA
ncbi:MAG: hypothetical protein AB8B85_10515 [Paracoccaceae bacterium]